jgi:anaerobic selenocysteine-containing dehydrogenase
VKVIEPPGESLPNQEIFRRLARSVGLSAPALYEEDRAIVATLLRQSGVGGTFEDLAAAGTVFPAAEPDIAFGDLVFPTPSGRIEIASAAALADGQPMAPVPHADPLPAEGRLRILSPASDWTMNGSYGNDAKLRRRLGPATVTLHPAEAASRGLAAGSAVELFNDTGSLALTVALSAAVPPGVALVPKGRWPKHEPNGANINAINPGRKADMGESSAVHGLEASIRAVAEEEPA